MDADTILIVEKDSTQRKYLSSFLQTAGYNVRSVENAADALAFIRQYRPALVLTDLRLPGMDGLALARAVKADERLAPIPIVAVTTVTLPGDVEHAAAAGCDGYIPRPIDFSLLEGYLERYLEKPDPS